MASVFWMLFTWFLWFLPDILLFDQRCVRDDDHCFFWGGYFPLNLRPPHVPSTTAQVLFTINTTALLYYYLRACRTDPGFVKSTEEGKKMVGAAANGLKREQ